MRFRFRSFIAVAIGAFGLAGVPLALAAQPRPFETVTIPADGYELAGYVSTAEEPNGVWVIFVHGNREEGQAHLLYRRIAGNLANDVSVLSIDMRGFGNSSSAGLETADRVLDRTGDIDAAVDYLKAAYGVEDSQVVLIGHSLGALQVLKAAQARTYRSVISIGPGDFRVFLADEPARRSYATKLGAAMGIRVAVQSIAEEGLEFVPKELFSPCPQSPVALVFGAFDLEESLRRAEGEILEACPGTARSVTIPLSDHMYGTEWAFLPGPVRSVASWLPVGLLLWNLDRLIAVDPG
jgi:pimeloyl-ACP methyl ester carboxylesterase